MPLVLKRRATETIVINGNTRVTVLEAGPGWARLLIEAPRDVRVDRLEVHEERAEYVAKDR